MEFSSKQKKITAVVASCVAVGVIASAMLGMAGPGGAAEGFEDEAFSSKTVVETQMPSVGNIVVTGSFVGTVEPTQQVTVYPKVNGEVLNVHYSIGDSVSAGDVLLEIDSTTIQYNIAQTQANLSKAQSQAQHSLDVAQQNLEDYVYESDEGLNSQLLAAEAQVKSAENALQTANNAYRLARQNYNDYVNGDYDYDNGYIVDSDKEKLRNARVAAELQVESAQLGLENAKANLEAVRKAVEEAKVAAENSVKSAEISANMSAEYIALQQLQTTLSDYSVTSPISGVIEQRNVDPFDIATTGTQAFVISNKEAMTVSFEVTENSLTYMSPGDFITLEKNGETTYGVITEVSTMVDTSGLYTVKALVENPPFEMHSGSTIKLYADTQKVENEIVIPIDAVYYDNGEPFVYIFRDNTAVKTYIETGIADTDNIQVISGLSLSDELIVTWSSNLYDGAEVYLPGTAPAEEPGEVAQEQVQEDAAPETDGAADEEPATEDLEEIADEGDEGDEAETDTPNDGVDAISSVQGTAESARVEQPAGGVSAAPAEEAGENAQAADDAAGADNDEEGDDSDSSDTTSGLRGF